MTAYNCPFGRLTCDGCTYLTSAGCLEKVRNTQAFYITSDGMIDLWERRKEELMKLSKEELVEMIIGKREHVGTIFG